MENEQMKTDLKELQNQRTNLVSSMDDTRNESEKGWVTAMIKDIDNKIDQLNG